MPQPGASLDDRFTRTDGIIYLSGLQALVRLLLMQRQLDVRAGLNTAGFVSGYRGSPLAGFDQQLWRAQRFLDQHHIRFQPGLNEDLAATSVWGSQQVNLFPGARYDGVFAMWYGKGPGVDRCGDVFRHANAYGTSRHGGVLAIAGDDHAARSSTFPHQTEHDFVAVMMPVLHPAGVQELLDFGIVGWAMSRFSGCWVAIKATAELLDSSATVDASIDRVQLVTPADVKMPPGGLNARWPDWPLEQELRLQRYKVYAAIAFAAANGLDRVVIDSPHPRFGIITTGKSYLDVRQALDDLGIDERVAADIGLRLYKVGMPWPLGEDGVRAFARGLEEVLVVEEKRGIIENQLKSQLFNWDQQVRPRIVGKFDGEGNWLLPAAGELTAAQIARVIAARIAPFHASEAIRQRLAILEQIEKPLAASALLPERIPFYCSGCPHNTSTRVPEGSRALAGIGCHYMVLRMDRDTATFTQMGGEGATWIGQAPFTETPHVFQNLGDGTYFHSGLLAIRAAIAAEVNITYKLLYNHAVAMTGGQPFEGELTVAQITRQLDGEGVKRIAVVTDDLDAYADVSEFSPQVTFHHRRELDRVQREMRDVPGVSVLIYDQMCAAEKRRRRKRGQLEDPAKRVFINEWVCEACGDCSAVSNCLSVVPLETPLGRKRAINQDSCNKDYSCVQGFCPSFVTVHGGRLRRHDRPAPDPVSLPEPVLPADQPVYSIVIAGIGGTGVVTVSAVLGMAAHLDGRSATALDQTGLSQKFGAVTSHVRIARAAEVIYAPRIPAGDADLLLAADKLVGGSAEALDKLSVSRSAAVVNTEAEMPAAFVEDRDFALPDAALLDAIGAAVGEGHLYQLNATRLAMALVGDSIAANFLLLGYAWQKGLVPIRDTAILEAIALNGVAVEQNRRAFLWGRQAAHDPTKLQSAVEAATPPRVSEDLQAVVQRRIDFLRAYQNARYAQRYADMIKSVEAAERERTASVALLLTMAVARNYFKLLAYKDEYEVARLYTGTEFLENLSSRMEGPFRLRLHLAPPLLSRHDPLTGRPRKREFGGWILWLFRVLKHLKPLRGTWLDPFGYAAERKAERQLIVEYEALLAEILPVLSRDNHATAVELASLPDQIRGFGPIKKAAIAQAKRCEASLLERFRNAGPPPTPPAPVRPSPEVAEAG
jgi:indolepyruvate ferredoxin oxidoreductase